MRGDNRGPSLTPRIQAFSPAFSFAFSRALSPSVRRYVAVVRELDECSRLLLTANCMRGPPKFFECVSSLDQRHGISHGAPPRAYAVYTNAQFGVTRDRILARSLHTYERLLAEFDAPEAQQCFTIGGAKARPHRGTCAQFEFLWHALLGETPILDPRRTMSGQRGDHHNPGEDVGLEQRVPHSSTDA